MASSAHIVELLGREGGRVRALALDSSFNDWGWLEGLSCLDDMEVISGDIRDADWSRDVTKATDVISQG